MNTISRIEIGRNQDNSIRYVNQWTGILFISAPYILQPHNFQSFLILIYPLNPHVPFQLDKLNIIGATG